MKIPPEVVRLLSEARTIVISSHAPMDGDGLGCALALRRALEPWGKQVTVVTEAPLPKDCAFLAGYSDVVLLEDGPVPTPDLLIGVDAGSPDRLGRVYSERTPATRVLNLDHHASNTDFGDASLVDPTAAATGEVVYALLREMGAPLDEKSALCLLVALVTDTGRFGYSNTTARTFEVAADLVRLGADPETANDHLYRSVSPALLRLRAQAATALQIRMDGRLAVLTVPEDFGRDLGLGEEEVKNLIDIGASLSGVLVAVLVRGVGGGGSKVSLRSRDDRADVSKLAERHGGGGHIRAAGFSSADPPDATERALAGELETLVVAASG